MSLLRLSACTAGVRGFIQEIRAGDGSLEELLTTALSELCKVKPEGLDAVRYLLVPSANTKCNGASAVGRNLRPSYKVVLLPLVCRNSIEQQT